jgi:hypothetical protein
MLNDSSTPGNATRTNALKSELCGNIFAVPTSYGMNVLLVYCLNSRSHGFVRKMRCRSWSSRGSPSPDLSLDRPIGTTIAVGSLEKVSIDLRVFMDFHFLNSVRQAHEVEEK